MGVVKVKDHEYHIDGFLLKNLDFVKPLVKLRNEMHVTIIDGRIGTGKSTIVDQLAYYCSDGNFSLNDKAFCVKHFSELLEKAEKGQPNNNIVLDEAFELNRRKSNSLANYKILKQLQRIRSKNLWIWIVLPSVYDLDKNIILNLSNLFIHTYTDFDFAKKGKYSVYSRHSLKKLWLYCRESLSYYTKYSRPAFKGRFTARFPSGNYEKYEREKNKQLDEADKEEDKPKFNRWLNQRNMLIRKAYSLGMKKKEIAEFLELHPGHVYKVFNPCQ